MKPWLHVKTMEFPHRWKGHLIWASAHVCDIQVEDYMIMVWYGTGNEWPLKSWVLLMGRWPLPVMAGLASRCKVGWCREVCCIPVLPFTQSCENLFIHYTHFSCQIVLKIGTKHSSDTALRAVSLPRFVPIFKMIWSALHCLKFQNDKGWWDISRFNVHFWHCVL